MTIQTLRKVVPVVKVTMKQPLLLLSSRFCPTLRLPQQLLPTTTMREELSMLLQPVLLLPLLPVTQA
jgi:hypothetical protein